MSDQSKPYCALYGSEARSDWLTYIINLMKAVSRQRLLYLEMAAFRAQSVTPEEERLFDAFVWGEQQQIREAREQMIGALQDIMDMGECYVDSLRGRIATLPPYTSAEAGRHMPIVGRTMQHFILDATLTDPRPEELARVVPTLTSAQTDPRGSQNFAAEELRHLITVQQRRFCTCGSQAGRPYQPRRPMVKTESDISDAAATKGADSVEDDDGTTEDTNIVKGEDIDCEAVLKQVVDLVKLDPNAPSCTPQERHQRMMAERFESIVTVVTDAVLATPNGWADDETRIREIEIRLREVLAPLPLSFTVEIGRFCNDLELQARRERAHEQAEEGPAFVAEHVPAEGEAGPLTGPGTLPHSNQEHQARVEDGREDSPDPVLIALPDSDSAYGSASESGSEPHTPE